MNGSSFDGSRLLLLATGVMAAFFASPILFHLEGITGRDHIGAVGFFVCGLAAILASLWRE